MSGDDVRDDRREAGSVAADVWSCDQLRFRREAPGWGWSAGEVMDASGSSSGSWEEQHVPDEGHSTARFAHFRMLASSGDDALEVFGCHVGLRHRLRAGPAPFSSLGLLPGHCFDVIESGRLLGRVWPLLGLFGGKLRMRVDADDRVIWIQQRDRIGSADWYRQREIQYDVFESRVAIAQIVLTWPDQMHHGLLATVRRPDELWLTWATPHTLRRVVAAAALCVPRVEAYGEVPDMAAGGP